VWKKYFNFSRSEKNGIVVLVFLLLLLLVVLKLRLGEAKRAQLDFSAFETEIAQFKFALKDRPPETYQTRLDKHIAARYDSLQLFDFDPNSTTFEQWLKLGLTEKQARTIQNYTTKGGKFYEKKDFRKMYGIRTKQYQILEPFLKIDKSKLPALASRKRYEKTRRQKDEPLPVYAPFDPNTATAAELQKMGVPAWLCKSLVNYRAKGGSFRKKSDLKKIYNFPDKLYANLEPYIQIPPRHTTRRKTPAEPHFTLELNSCDSVQLAKIPQLKPYHIKNILHYRDRLGGFLKVEQLKEVKYFKAWLYDKIEKYLTVNSLKIRKLNINQADFKTLNRHPYISYEQTKKILSYRQKNGNFANPNDLVLKNLLSQKNYDKLKPYIVLW